MKDLEDISHHIHDRISSSRRLLELSLTEIPQGKLEKLGQELMALQRLLEDLETCVGQKREQLNHLKELEGFLQMSLVDVKHMKDNTPPHMPRKQSTLCAVKPEVRQNKANFQPAQAENVKHVSKSFVREMEFLTTPEFENIPKYMRGRVSYDQVNAAVEIINTTVTAKYKILHQPIKSLSNHTRKLRQRFYDQETKDSKGQYFIVDEDIQEFTQMKVDKRFQGILNMLRHCQRLRQLRGGGITRYLLT